MREERHGRGRREHDVDQALLNDLANLCDVFVHRIPRRSLRRLRPALAWAGDAPGHVGVLRIGENDDIRARVGAKARHFRFKRFLCAHEKSANPRARPYARHSWQARSPFEGLRSCRHVAAAQTASSKHSLQGRPRWIPNRNPAASASPAPQVPFNSSGPTRTEPSRTGGSSRGTQIAPRGEWTITALRTPWASKAFPNRSNN